MNDVLPEVVGAIGDDRFAPALALYLHELCGAEHFAAFDFACGELSEVAACCVNPERTARDRVESYVKQGWWKRDPVMLQARHMLDTSSAGVIQADWSDRAYQDLRPSVYPDVRDRLLLCGRVADGAFGLSILRNDPNAPFTSDAIERFRDSSALLLALLAKHADVCRNRRDASQALAALHEIEDCVADSRQLPRRESQVCARILYGLSSTGIALDLDVSEETVKTYRKRAYQRLAIGSERELLNWYLAQWSRRGGVQPARLH
jgi:DNA-binding CsgD family transcriptional regulator